MKKVFITIMICAVVVLLYTQFPRVLTPPLEISEPVTLDSVVITEPIRLCFERSQIATEDAPYTVLENIEIAIADDGSVKGTKSGTQSGPDMTNGYTGELRGTKVGKSLELVYSYTVEGSTNKELELYELNSYDEIVKLRWPLQESPTMLIPTKEGDPTKITYTSAVCE